MPNYTRPDELMHYGVLGMKWGVRRYQNDDGSLTPAGKLRQRRHEANDLKKQEKKRFKEDIKKYGKAKHIIDLTYDGDGVIFENRGTAMINRLTVEKGKQYADRIVKADKRRTMAPYVGALAGSAVVAVGYAWLAAKYDL